MLRVRPNSFFFKMPVTPGHTQLAPDMRRLRAIKMIEMKVMRGLTNRALAEMFNVADITVDRTLSWARKAGLVADLEDRILTELGPAAVDCVKQAMEDGKNPDIALKVLTGLRALRPETAGKGRAEEGDDLDVYIREIRDKSEAAPAALEGQIVPSGLLPAATDSSGEVHDAEGTAPAGTDAGEAEEVTNAD